MQTTVVEPVHPGPDKGIALVSIGGAVTGAFDCCTHMSVGIPGLTVSSGPSEAHVMVIVPADSLVVTLIVGAQSGCPAFPHTTSGAAKAGPAARNPAPSAPAPQTTRAAATLRGQRRRTSEPGRNCYALCELSMFAWIMSRWAADPFGVQVVRVRRWSLPFGPAGVGGVLMTAMSFGSTTNGFASTW